MQKRPHSVFRRNKVFSVFLIQKIQSQNKDFYPKMDELAMREHFGSLPLALRFFPTVTFRLILGKFLWVFLQIFSFFSVFSEFSTRLVLFWYQSLVSIFRKIGGEKIRYSLWVIDTWLCPTVQLALMFEYKGGCKGRVPWEQLYYIRKMWTIQRCHKFRKLYKSINVLLVY